MLIIQFHEAVKEVMVRNPCTGLLNLILYEKTTTVEQDDTCLGKAINQLCSFFSENKGRAEIYDQYKHLIFSANNIEDLYRENLNYKEAETKNDDWIVLRPTSEERLLEDKNCLNKDDEGNDEDVQ